MCGFSYRKSGNLRSPDLTKPYPNLMMFLEYQPRLRIFKK